MMTPLLIALSILFPLLLCLGYVRTESRPHLPRTLPLAAAPALALALFGSDQVLQLPWLLEGSRWGLDDLRRPFLAFASLVWLLTGLYSLPYFSGQDRTRHFALFWLLNLCGNLGLILAQDIASFYTFFALMTLASYGLVAHSRTPQALRAGRIYIIMSLAGEMLLLAGLSMAAAGQHLTLLTDLPEATLASPYRDWILALLVSGLGVKAGLPLLHMWLPLAHPVAPVPASAVLSGVMIKAGLLGWLFLLPLQQGGLETWGGGLILFGLVAAFGAALAGTCQRQPKTVLAYSSISQMGLMTILVGVGLAAPNARETIQASVAVYAMHHGLAKASLFLAAGTVPHAGGWPRALFWLLAGLPALSLTGLVLSSGAAAKGLLKDALAQLDSGLALEPWLEPLVNGGAVATTLLMARFLFCLWPQWGSEKPGNALVGYWALAVLASLLLFWVLPRPEAAGSLSTGLAHPLDYLWPTLAGAVAALLAWKLGARALPIPPGDLIVPLERAYRRFHQLALRGGERLDRIQQMVVGGSDEEGRRLLGEGTRWLRAEQTLRGRPGLIFVLLLAALLVALLVPYF